MEDRLLNIIEKEDKKNPYTDYELAELLNTKRETITSLRSRLNIPNSMERRKEVLLHLIRDLINENNRVSERELTKKINDCGFNVSRHTVRMLKREISEMDNIVKVAAKEKPDFKKTYKKPLAFENIIGFDGSLKPVIEQAKAAIMYPPNGLHTLILGPTGVGKSELAQAMYNYKLEINKGDHNSEFIVFNCADYADNPQLLISQLFGYVKGAFTGADEDKEGLVEKADGGVLFLDEIHRLPPEGQELLFYLIDRGKFRRLGETDNKRTANLMIIAATTENPDSILLDSFRRRIPMTIELPSLSLRPLNERLGMIIDFMRREANRTKSSIKISNDALKALLLYDCPGNIGQLRSDIQVSCARSFLNHVVNQTRIMEISINELPISAKKGLLKIPNYRMEIDKLVGNEDLIVYADDEIIEETLKEDLYTLPNETYSFIERRYKELQKQSINEELINYIIGNEMEEKLEKLMDKVKKIVNPIDKKDLSNIVGIEIINVVENIIKIAKWKLGVNEDSLYFCLATHLRATVDRAKKGIFIKNPQLNKIKKEYSREFEVAKDMVNIIEQELNIKFTEDEIGFITMYLQMTTSQDNLMEGRVGVVLISHGNVATGMAEVANRLLGVNHAKAIEMSLDENPEQALKRAIDLVKRVDEGKGVLLMVDMGSLVTFGDIITKTTGIKTRTISRTDTLMVVDAVRRCILPNANLDEIVESLVGEPKYEKKMGGKQSLPKPKIILTVCITGQGSAKRIQEMVIDIIGEYKEDVTVIPIGVLDENINNIIEEIQRDNEIIAVVGTINPMVKDVPYISIEDIVNGSADTKLKNIMAKEVGFKKTQKNKIINMFHRNTTIFDMDAMNKEDTIKELGHLLHKEGYVLEGFIDAALNREQLGPSFLREGVALPHADPSFVVEPHIAIGLLKNPIDWSGYKVNLVLLLAINDECMELILELKRFFENDENYNEIIKTKDFEDIEVLFRRS